MSDGPVSFDEYLEAKYDLDERSFNREVREAFWQALSALPSIECLDVGAGTGATARRLLRHFTSGDLAGPLSLTALDRDPALLNLAREDASSRLRALGPVAYGELGELRIEGNRPVAIRFADCELEDYRRDQQSCNLITAHAFLDIVPLAQTLGWFTTWLQPGGYLYATLNYDGDTALLPIHEDADFEASLLRHYDDTMERRRVGGLATGGARCGRRLHSLLPDHGFDILACGSSDWNITPLRGEYRGRDAHCLRALLEMIHAEGQRAGLFDGERLAHWHADRMRLLRERRLGMIVHQLDLLARYDP